MPATSDAENPEGDGSPKLTLFQRIRYTMVKPDDDGGRAKEVDTRSLAELEAEMARADDKERAIGLIAAPLAAAIAILVGGSQINNAIDTHQSTSEFYTLLYTLAGMSVLMLVTALLRKRLLLGMVVALFGLGVFNLKDWGFGIPFVMVGAWYLVRSYRLSQKVKLASGNGPGSGRSGGAPPRSPRPRSNKRYTPPSS